LSNGAANVVGLDVDEQTINHASSLYVASNLTFLCGSVTRIPIEGSHQFDLVVSFETIEHLSEEDQKAFLHEVKRLLKPEGVLLISSPNKRAYSDITHFHNEFHVRELYVNEFTSLVETEFKHTRLLGQRVYPVSYIWPTTTSMPHLVEYRLDWTEAGHRPSDAPKEFLYTLLVASDVPDVEGQASILVDLSDSMLRRHPNVVGREQQIEDLQRELADAHAEVGRLQSENSAVVVGREQRIEDLQRELADAHAEVDRLQSEHSAVDAQGLVRKLEGLRSELEATQDILRVQDGRLSELDAERCELQSHLAQRDHQLAAYSTRLATVDNSAVWRLGLRWAAFRKRYVDHVR
ncbi:MAG: class I SAM-dependent methyltransferase, partial [Sulfobacillus sp.]